MPEYPWVRTFQFQVNVPANTTAANPQVSVAPIGPNVILRRVILTVPSGHVGLTGFALVYAGEHVLPFQRNTFLVLDGITLTFDFDFPVWDSEIEIRTVNADIIEHTFLVVFQVDDVELLPPAAPVMFAAELLEGLG